MHDYKGDILDNRYLVENRIGKGGMGVVYQGRHVIIGRKVAIKFLSSEYAGSEEVVTRFYREAQTATQIGHKNIIEILDVGTSEEQEPYIVMEFLEGEDLGALLKRVKTLNLSAACGILEPVLSALAAAHDKGVVHRDLKPENIFLHHDPSSGEVVVKLIDFGISKLMTPEADKKLTLTGSALGTPHYMSPEQTSGSDEVDHRTDIYAMGVILFEMLTGETPYTASSHQILMVKILTEAPRDPYEVNPAFPEEAYPIVQRALSRDVSERFASAVEMLEALRRLSIYDERYTQLTACTSGISPRTSAMGDLGGARSKGALGPSRSLKEAARRGTLGSWAGSKPFVSGARSSGRRLKIALFITAVAAMVIGGGFFVWQYRNGQTNAATTGSGTSSAATTPAVLTKDPAASHGQTSLQKKPASAVSEGRVHITLTGVPVDAAVTFGDEAVSSEAFDAPLQSVARMLVVKSRGYQIFEKEILPDRDQVVNVELISSPSAGQTSPLAESPSSALAETKKSVNIQPGKNVNQPPAAHEKSSSKDEGFIQGRRKTEIAESFE